MPLEATSNPARSGAARDARIPLISTKLAPPLAPPGYVARPRVESLLDRSVGEAVSLTLVAAPPGYGKTLAVAGWLESRGLPRAWLSLDPEENDLARFCRYLGGALAAVRPAVAAVSEGLFGAGATPAPELVGATFIEALAADDASFVLVLDDYHVISTAPVQMLVRFLIERAPPFCHLVLVTREDPPLPLARLRAHRRLVDIRAQELGYTDEEVAAYLAALGLSLNPALIRRLVRSTEGWAAGIQLASLSLTTEANPEEALAAFGGSQRFVLDYLADETLDRTDEATRDFLARTAIADRFTPDLCAELSGRADAAAVLERIERAQLFLVALDQERRWYRYHQLFAECLRNRLDRAEKDRLHARAAAWLESAGLPAEAIPHYLAAGATDNAARLIGSQARRLFDAGEHATLLAWLDALPPDTVEASAELTSWRAWALFDTGQLGAADDLAQRHLATSIERGPAEARLLVLRALLQTVTGPDAEALAGTALGLLDDDDFFRSSALQAIGLAMLARGDLPGAVERLTEAFELTRHTGAGAAFAALTPLGQALNSAGRRDEAERLCLDALDEYGPAARRGPMAWYMDVLLGLLRYEANDLAQARLLLERGFEAAAKLRVGRMMVEWGVAYLALARQATGSPDAALDALRTAARDIRASGLVIPVPIAETEARIWLAEGDVNAAARWADDWGHAAAGSSPLAELFRVGGATMAARVRLVQRRPDEAAALLKRAVAGRERPGDVTELISILMLQSAANEARGMRRQALDALREAIRLAAPGGYLRRIVEDAVPVAHLLPLARKTDPAFVDAVIAALGTPVAGRHPASTWQADGRLIETLTGRELDVLRLLANGARNVEIAQALGVSVGTARWHVGNVLSKLGEGSRAKAVVRARELGLV